MAKATIERVSLYGRKGVSPHPDAVLVDEGNVYINTGEPITHWEIEINSLADLARLYADGEHSLVVSFDGDDVSFVIIYDDYLE